MLIDYLGVFIGVVIVAVICIGLYFVIKRSKTSNKSESFLPKPTRDSSELPPPQYASKPELPQHPSGNAELVTKLRQNLRVKVLYDDAKIERLINFERKYNPAGSETELMQAAIDRWEQDNR